MDLNKLFQAVMALDLAPIKLKLMHVESGEGWSQDKADAVEMEYRRFLCLMKLYPEAETAPLVDVDTFWHYHILDTMKYAIDCEQVFGYFLHHYPYVGLHEGSDPQCRIDGGDRMRDLYEATFSEAYPPARLGIAAKDETRDTSYRARFGIALQVDTAVAWCASPGGRKTVSNDAVAWCASPGARPAASNDTVAWCASPGARPAAGNDTVAWCASPGIKNARAGTAIAWCASPGSRQPACAA